MYLLQAMEDNNGYGCKYVYLLYEMKPNNFNYEASKNRTDWHFIMEAPQWEKNF